MLTALPRTWFRSLRLSLMCVTLSLPMGWSQHDGMHVLLRRAVPASEVDAAFFCPLWMQELSITLQFAKNTL